MSSGPSPGNQSMYHHSNTFQQLGWGSTDNQRSTFSITGQNPPPMVIFYIVYWKYNLVLHTVICLKIFKNFELLSRVLEGLN